MAWKQSNPNDSDQAKRAALVAALASGSSNAAAARASGYSRTHVQRLLADPTFAAEVAAARGQTTDGAGVPAGPSSPEAGERIRARVESMTERAIDALEAVLGDKEAPHAARVKAAEVALKVGLERLAPPAKAEPVVARLAPPTPPPGPGPAAEEDLDEVLDELEEAAGVA